MARRSVHSAVVALSIISFVAACGNNDNSTVSTATTVVPSTSGSSPSDTSAADNVDALRQRLLTEEDLPSGWSDGEDINEFDLAFNAEICPGTVMNATIAERLNGQVGAQFEPADGAPRHLMQQLRRGDDERQLANDLDAFHSTVQACIDATGTSAPSTLAAGDVAINEFALPAMGDQSFAFVGAALEGSAGPTWYIRTAIVRVGDIVMSIGEMEVLDHLGADLDMSDAEFIDLVTTAVDKLTA